MTFPRLAGKFRDHQEPSLFLSCCYTPSWSNTAAHAPSIMSAFQLEGRKKWMLKCISPFKKQTNKQTSKKFQPPLLPICRTSAKRPYLATSHIGRYSLDPGSEKLGLWCEVRRHEQIPRTPAMSAMDCFPSVMEKLCSFSFKIR